MLTPRFRRQRIVTARALPRMYGAIANGGEIDAPSSCRGSWCG
ncbi:hypothetical protein I551_8514 [Mycobacterium ulcerans str. Harvey]|uniref:Uncharacterized protein n=1 Tax=Mycobacterium ulcerans str. Harvey TaxID=1299332 RepID=A0ABN0RAM7_MYCUL|nr:hypothetical protein I551_8514 [Mycobacterium ulcerans str. Harvey]